MAVGLLQVEVTRGPTRRPGHGVCLEILPTADTGREGVFASQAIVVTNAARRVIALAKAAEKVDALAVMGAADPKRHPDFREITENLREVAKKWYPKAQLLLFCGPCHFDTADVRRACGYYDRVWVEFDAGTQKTFAAAYGKDASLKDSVDRLVAAELDRIVLHVCLSQGQIDNGTDTEVRGLISSISRIRPMKVVLSSPPKGGGAKAPRKPLSKSRVEEIASKLGEKTGISVEILPEA